MSFTKVLYVFIVLASLPTYFSEEFNHSRLVSQDGTETGVFDELFTSEHLETIKDFFSEVSWEFKSDFTGSVCPDCTRSFQSWLPVHAFSSSPTWARIKSALAEFRDEGQVYPRSVRGRILLPGEYSPGQTCSEQQKHVIFVFWNKQWGTNSYGELMIFDKNGEVAHSMRPKFGRVVILPCPGKFLAHPPAIGKAAQRLRYLEITSTSSKDLFEKQSVEQRSLISARELNYVRKFILLNTSRILNVDTQAGGMEQDLGRFLTHRFATSSGKKVLVFDGLLQRTDVERLFDMMYHGIYQDSPAEEDNSADNVQWVLGVDTIPFLQTTLWTLVKSVVRYTSGQDTFYPYDVSCNHIQSLDQTEIHRDCGENEDEYTFMIYLNPNWTTLHYGETVFFNDDDEILAAVTPKHGRVVIFHGVIRHSARPPSPIFQGVRYTFVVKLSSPQERAFNKSVHLEVDPKDDVTVEVKSIKLQQLKRSYYEAEDEQLNDQELENPEFLSHVQEMEKQVLQSLSEM